MADAAITDQQKVLLTATATDANGLVVVDAVTFRRDGDLGDNGDLVGPTDTTVEFVPRDAFNVGTTQTFGVIAQDATGLDSPSFLIDIIGTLPLPATAIVIHAGEPESK